MGLETLQPSYIDLTAGNILVGDASGNAASVTLKGDPTVANNGVATIANGAITSAKINDGAITNDKVASGIQVQKVNFGSGNITPDVLDLASAKIFVGNASGNAAAVTMTGDISIDNLGATSLGSGVVGTGTIANSAVTNDKLASGIQIQKINFGSETFNQTTLI